MLQRMKKNVQWYQAMEENVDDASLVVEKLDGMIEEAERMQDCSSRSKTLSQLATVMRSVSMKSTTREMTITECWDI